VETKIVYQLIVLVHSSTILVVLLYDILFFLGEISA